MQYRADFFVGALHGRVLRLLERGADVRLVGAAPDASPAGRSPEAALVTAWFTLPARASSTARCSRRCMAVVEHIRKGTLDFVLLKPADAQFLVSTAKLRDLQLRRRRRRRWGWRVWALHRLHRVPTRGQVAIALVLTRGGGGAALRAGDPGHLGGVLGRAARQPHLSVQQHLRRRALAGVGVSRLLAHPVHLRRAARAR